MRMAETNNDSDSRPDDPFPGIPTDIDGILGDMCDEFGLNDPEN